MPKQMVGLRVNEVSGVDRAANLVEGWMVQCSASPETAAILAEAELLAKGISTPERTAPMAFDPEALAALTKTHPEAAAHITALEATVAKAATTPPVAPAAAELSDDEKLAKALAEVPEPVRKAIAEMQRQNAEAHEEIRKAKDAAETERYTSLAKSLAHVPGIDDTFGATMLKASRGDGVAFGTVLEVLAKAEAVLKNSAAFSEIGSSAPAAGSAEEEIASVAKALQAKDATLTEAAAMLKAAEENPALYTRYSKEMNRRNKGLEG